MYDHILIPTDRSIETEQAVSHGLGLARTYDATVHALYVTDESEFSAVTDASAHEQLRTLSQLNDLEGDQLTDADRERIETATALLEEVSLFTRPKSE